MTRSLRLRDLELIPVAGSRMGVVRQELGITAFGANSFAADAGEQIFEPHDELSENSGSHEELYVVVHGSATFSVGDERIDAPAGTLVLARPGDWRGATAEQDGTAVLVLGGPPGAAGPVSAWERIFVATRYEDDPERAYAELSLALPDWPEQADVHYNLGCYAARLGRRESALEHMRVALAASEENRREARSDPDLDSIRAELEL